MCANDRIISVFMEFTKLVSCENCNIWLQDESIVEAKKRLHSQSDSQMDDVMMTR